MYHISENLFVQKNLKNKPLIIGYFDCIHKGHKKLFQYVEKEKFNVLTFINSPKKQNNVLSAYNQRLKNIQHFSPKNIFVMDLAKYNISPEEFEEKILKIISPSEIIVGQNFLYGKNRKGNVATLSKKFNVKTFKCLKKHQTREIVKNIKENKWSKVKLAIAKPIFFEGVVIHGKKLGRKLGFPTANISMKSKYVELTPGVYSGYTIVDCLRIPSAIFVRPKQINQTIESHILKGFNKNIYGKTIQIEIKQFIRKSKKVKPESKLSEYISQLVKKINRSF